VLIEGETGTGKELVAKAIHYHSERSGPFVALNCSAIPNELLESELFGYERGAFTDAKTQKKGLLEVAQGGSLFLDEIGDMSGALQAKLLRVLEERRFRRLGGIRDVSVDVRVIAATNRDLRAAAEAASFRKDLYYRLQVVTLTLPPLRQRREDVALLARHFLEHFGREFKKSPPRLSPEAEQLLVRYDWPGNVRELRNVIERVMILEDTDEVLPGHLPAEIGRADPAPADRSPFQLPSGGVVMEEVERDLVRQALEAAGGNQTRSARLLGLTRDELRYRVKKFGLGHTEES